MPLDSRGALAFSADEVSVLRRALALALRPGPASAHSGGPERAGERRDLERLAGDVAEAVRESARLRAFLQADLARYRAALPGSSTGYLDRLREAAGTGRPPGEEDLAALRSLCADPAVSPADAARARALLRNGERRGVTGHAVRPAVGEPAPHRPPAAPRPRPAARPTTRLAAVPGPVRRLLAVPALPVPSAPSVLPVLPGSRTATAAEPAKRSRPRRDTDPAEKPPAGRPDPERPAGPESEPPARPVPTPAEVFPPRRPPAPAPPQRPEEGRAAG
ncbi:hypothetical protein [Streptomyces sp. F63]|uniref:hypothetical protein n=1 Tax=Streptomyces sp. F63 TaxID=2824887 RepID=UPI0027DD200E|nr:hypothetical protein [Streptomyces sp. F63]